MLTLIRVATTGAVSFIAPLTDLPRAKSGLQVFKYVIEECDQVGLGVSDPVELGGDHHPQDGASQGSGSEVVGLAAGPLGDDIRDSPDRLGELVEHRGAQVGDREHELDAVAHVGRFFSAQSFEEPAQCFADRGYGAGIEGLGTTGLDDERVVIIGQHEVLFGGEVAEQGARGDLRGRRDLLGRRRLVSLQAKQPERLALDRGSGPGLLALTQAAGLGGRQSRCSPGFARIALESAARKRTEGRKTNVSSTPATAKPADTTRASSMPCTNAARTDAVANVHIGTVDVGDRSQPCS